MIIFHLKITSSQARAASLLASFVEAVYNVIPGSALLETLATCLSTSIARAAKLLLRRVSFVLATIEAEYTPGRHAGELQLVWLAQRLSNSLASKGHNGERRYSGE